MRAQEVWPPCTATPLVSQDPAPSAVFRFLLLKRLHRPRAEWRARERWGGGRTRWGMERSGLRGGGFVSKRRHRRASGQRECPAARVLVHAARDLSCPGARRVQQLHGNLLHQAPDIMVTDRSRPTASAAVVHQREELHGTRSVFPPTDFS